MQKSFIAIALALTLTSALAGYTTNNYVKAPQQVVTDAEYNYTNKSITLGSLNSGELDIYGNDGFINIQNVTQTKWTIYYKKLDAKTLSAGSNSTATVVAPPAFFFLNGYAISIGVDNDTNNVPQIWVFQCPLNGAQLPKLKITSNTNNAFSVSPVTFAVIGKNFYVFYGAAEKKVNVTNFAIGGSAGSNEFTLSANLDADLSKAKLSVVWGEGLGNNQLYANWLEGGVLKGSVLDVSKGSVVNATNIGGWDKNFNCKAYATDKKWYGDICGNFSAIGANITYFVRSNTSDLTKYGVYPYDTSSLGEIFPYGPYLAVVLKNQTNYAYEIWNLDSWANFKNRTEFLSIQDNSTVNFVRIPAGGVYTLLYNNAPKMFEPVTSVQVGLLLGSSYLATVLGFLLTIVAGLFLF